MCAMKRLCLGFCLAMLLALFSQMPCHSQGFLPPLSSTPTVTHDTGTPLHIDEKMPESLMAVGQDGKERPLLSYKAAVEVLIIGIFSVDCPDLARQWRSIARFYEDYQGWQVAFVAVQAGPEASADDLAKTMKKNGLPIPMVTLRDQALRQILGVQRIPEFLIVDESGFLQYRGPGGPPLRKAVEAVIGHIDSVPNPEPDQQVGCPLP
jgi:hypothetical protein